MNAIKNFLKSKLAKDIVKVLIAFASGYASGCTPSDQAAVVKAVDAVCDVANADVPAADAGVE